MLTRITDWKVPCAYIHVYRAAENWGTGPYNSLRHADNRWYFSGLSLMWNRREGYKFYLAAREVGKFGHVFAEKKVTFDLMINEFKYGQTWKTWPSPLSLSLYNACKFIFFDPVSHKFSFLISVGKLYYLTMKHQKINVSQIFLFPITFKM